METYSLAFHNGFRQAFPAAYNDFTGRSSALDLNDRETASFLTVRILEPNGAKMSRESITTLCKMRKASRRRQV